MADHWYNSYSKVVLFGKRLHQAELLKDVDDVFDYFTKPSVYDDAYSLWESLGSPKPGDKEWDKFEDNVEVVDVGDVEDGE